MINFLMFEINLFFVKLCYHVVFIRNITSELMVKKYIARRIESLRKIWYDKDLNLFRFKTRDVILSGILK